MRMMDGIRWWEQQKTNGGQRCKKFREKKLKKWFIFTILNNRSSAKNAELQIRVEDAANNAVPVLLIPTVDEVNNVERTGLIAMGTDIQMLEQQFHIGKGSSTRENPLAPTQTVQMEGNLANLSTL
ncbi:hypothetical protein LWI29_037639 [Acer saccharum]|uniref:Uncharacterized protein n=1 Tax=Acer saccharum TaxID=4024 RepID=A0AA39SKH4_ACESA|nr:hypothetical protein LWI29_037639 [Acer saccharum]